MKSNTSGKRKIWILPTLLITVFCCVLGYTIGNMFTPTEIPVQGTITATVAKQTATATVAKPTITATVVEPTPGVNFENWAGGKSLLAMLCVNALEELGESFTNYQHSAIWYAKAQASLDDFQLYCSSMASKPGEVPNELLAVEINNGLIRSDREAKFVVVYMNQGLDFCRENDFDNCETNVVQAINHMENFGNEISKLTELLK